MKDLIALERIKEDKGMKYRLIVEPQSGSELDGYKRVYYPGVYTSKKKATEFAEALAKTGIKVVEIVRQ